MKKAYMDYYMNHLEQMGLLNEQLPPPPPLDIDTGATPSTDTPPVEAPVPDQASADTPTPKAPMPTPEAPMPGAGSEQAPTAGGDTPPPPPDESTQFAEYMNEYAKTVSKHADNPDLLRDALTIVRDKTDLNPTQRNFIEMNWSALSLLDERSVVDAQRQIRKSTDVGSMLQAAFAQVDASPDLQEAIQRMANMGPDKSNMFRQYLAALLGGVVVPGSTGGEVSITPKKSEETIILRPQAYTTWGFVDLGPVTLDGKSIDEYLGEEERTKLDQGAPEERRVLRNRLFIEAIANQLAGGTWCILVLNTDDGSWETVSFDANFFREAYEGGKIAVIEAAPEPTGELAVDEEGNFVTMATWGLAALSDVEEGQLDSAGERVPAKTPIASIQGGRLVWSANTDSMRMAGLDVSSHTWSVGTPEELRKVQRSIPDARAKLMGVS